MIQIRRTKTPTIKKASFLENVQIIWYPHSLAKKISVLSHFTRILLTGLQDRISNPLSAYIRIFATRTSIQWETLSKILISTRFTSWTRKFPNPHIVIIRQKCVAKVTESDTFAIDSRNRFVRISRCMQTTVLHITTHYEMIIEVYNEFMNIKAALLLKILKLLQNYVVI